jgi:hypothetical protein
MPAGARLTVVNPSSRVAVHGTGPIKRRGSRSPTITVPSCSISAIRAKMNAEEYGLFLTVPSARNGLWLGEDLSPG